QVFYRAMFGRLPDVGHCHPQRRDVLPTADHLRRICAKPLRALSIWSLQRATVAPSVKRWAPGAVAAGTEALLNPDEAAKLAQQGPFDLCFLELVRDELIGFGKLYP